MSLINWNTPKKVVRGGGFDGGPDTGYVPQMSDDDMRKWKGKHINKGKDKERIELRKTFRSCAEYAQVLVIVGKKLDPKGNATRRIEDEYGNVRISANGTIEMTFSEYDEMTSVISEARELLTK